MKVLTPLADYSQAGSPALGLRRRRFERFLKLVERCDKSPLRILDIGGTEAFWDAMGFANSGHEITLVNIFEQEARHDNFRALVGDARSMPQFDDNEFDLVFSNSVIEHLRNFDDQRRMAAEVRRLAPRYFIQTPNHRFPVEPHFLCPGFHYLPKPMRVWLIMHYRLGSYPRVDDRREAEELVNEIRLLTRAEFRSLFPDAKIYSERFCGLAKSFMAVKG
jgi:hypothetical protein